MTWWGKQSVPGIIWKMELLKKDYVLKKKIIVTLVRDGKEDFIQEGGTTALALCNRGERWDSTLNTARKTGHS